MKKRDFIDALKDYDDDLDVVFEMANFYDPHHTALSDHNEDIEISSYNNKLRISFTSVLSNKEY